MNARILFLTIVSAISFGTFFPVPVHAENPGERVVTPSVPSGQSMVYEGLVNEWETELFRGVITYEGKGGMNVVRPSWLLVQTERPESEWLTPPYFRLGGPYVFDLVHLGIDGKVQQKIFLGIGTGVRVSEDGQVFALHRLRWPEGFGQPNPCVREIEIKDKYGNLKKRFEGSRFEILYIGPGGSHTIALGDKHGLIEVYDSEFGLKGSFGGPPGEELGTVWTASRDGFFAVVVWVKEKNNFILYLFNPAGSLFVNPIPTREFEVDPDLRLGLDDLDIFPRQKLVVFQGQRSIEGRNREERYVTGMDFSGNVVFPDVLIPVRESKLLEIQVSDDGRYIRCYNRQNSFLLNREGTVLYDLASLYRKSPQAYYPPEKIPDLSPGAGLLTDKGVFVGFVPFYEHLVSINPSGQVEELPIRKASKLLAFDSEKGVVLSEEFSGNFSTRLVERRIPPDLLAEVKGKAGLR